MMIWEDSEEYYGIARIVRKQLQSGQSIALIQSFRSISSQKKLYEPVWGTAIGAIKTYEEAL